MLTYEEWKQTVISSKIKDDLMTFHNINADTDLEDFLKPAYEDYVKQNGNIA